MSKSILVIDTPENCRECKFSEYQGIVCRAMGLNKAHNNADSKPDWCPLAECGTDLLTREVKGLKYVLDKIKYFEFEESEIRDLEELDHRKQEEIDRLKIEVEKYRKAFEDAKEERDCQIAEYRKKIEELESRDIAELLPTGPIRVADMLINASKKRKNCMTGEEYDKYIFEKWQLKQIAKHLLIYCNHYKEEEE